MKTELSKLFCGITLCAAFAFSPLVGALAQNQEDPGMIDKLQMRAGSIADSTVGIVGGAVNIVGDVAGGTVDAVQDVANGAVNLVSSDDNEEKAESSLTPENKPQRVEAVKPALEISDMMIKKPVPGARAFAGTLIIQNNTDQDNALVSALSEVSDVIELHEMSMDNDIMRMRKTEKFVVPANDRAVLSMETGDHLMFINPKRELVAGEEIQVTLTFENGATIMALMPVVARDHDDSQGSHSDHDHSDMHDETHEKIENGAEEDSAVEVEIMHDEYQDHYHDNDHNHSHDHGHGHHKDGEMHDHEH